MRISKVKPKKSIHKLVFRNSLIMLMFLLFP